MSKCIVSIVSISSLGTVRFTCEFFDILPPSFPVKDIVVAFSLLANFIAFKTLIELPLPLIPITISFFFNRLSNCFLKIFSYLRKCFFYLRKGGIKSLIKYVQLQNYENKIDIRFELGEILVGLLVVNPKTNTQIQILINSFNSPGLWQKSIIK